MRSDTAEQLLSAAYEQLDFKSGSLLDASASASSISPDHWIAKGGWLQLAKKIGAEKIFFVDDNPVIVFINGDKLNHPWYRAFNRTWCLGRPPLLFYARTGEMTVFDLTRPPVREGEEREAEATRLLGTLTEAAQVQSMFQRFNRAYVEAGQLFQEERFSTETRADRSLVNDLRRVRRDLLTSNLSIPHAHALIGRSILIRYLEDRRILVEKYYRDIAGANRKWNDLLDAAPPLRPNDDRRAFYACVLQDKEFTDALFAKLSEDFNGDLFPFEREELKAFSVKRLDRIRRFLTSELEGDSLFFFAYDFEIIPIDLVSTIYEEFLKTKKGKSNTQGSFYTPGALVDFVLSTTLDEKTLNKRPRVIDPACGSGIFLVESFQRMVRHQQRIAGRDLSADELKQILQNQIAGIDVNGEAIRVAAFSLYLALLNFLDPPNILGHKLPPLVCSRQPQPDRDGSFNILCEANAFDIAASGACPEIAQFFSSSSADVVVGNPPWGQPKEQDEETRKAARTVMEWCGERGLAVGDKELSQAFVHRALDLLREGGKVGLLLSSGVLFKRARKSREFRKQWLEQSSLQEIVNFAAVRQVFFTGKGRSSGAIAPFISAVFSKCEWSKQEHKFRYFSAKRTAFLSGLQVVVLAKPDLHVVSQLKFMGDDDLWKVYWWGGHRDEALLKSLCAEDSLGSLIDPDGKHPERIGSGFKESRNRRSAAIFLSEFKALPTRAFTRYGPLPKNELVDSPHNIERERNRCIYEGWRLLVKAGIEEKDQANGRIISRLQRESFCFRHSIYGVRLPQSLVPDGRVLLGILWSSLTRYFLWLTSGRWGLWHHDILVETLYRVPIRRPRNAVQRRRVESIVEMLRGAEQSQGRLFDEPVDSIAVSDARKLEEQLDEAVFDLFDLDAAERDVVRDMCASGLDLFYAGEKSAALKPLDIPQTTRMSGRHDDLLPEVSPIYEYLDALLELWNAELHPDGQFTWQVIAPPANPMVAILLSTEGNPKRQKTCVTSTNGWNEVLDLLGSSARQPYRSARIYIDAMTRMVTEHHILLVKRNERRLWTRTAAREDAEATILETAQRQQMLIMGEIT